VHRVNVCASRQLALGSDASCATVGEPVCSCAWHVSASRTTDSAHYARDFNEVKALGSAPPTTGTPEQTATALFFSGNAVV